MTSFPDLDASIEVQAGIDVDALWERFEVFEALHHSMTICNPMTSRQVDDVIDALDVETDQRLVDVACGTGEVLIRIAATKSIRGTGVDLSPWMLNRAAGSGRERLGSHGLRWLLGDGALFEPAPLADVVVCIGAEWIWHDFKGTARALAARTKPGGRVAIGAARLHHAADQSAVATSHGRIDTIDDMRSMLLDHGLVPLARVDPDDAGWDDYLCRTELAARSWASRFPGERSERWLDEQADWQQARDRDREVIGWSVWIAERAGGA